MANPSGDTEYGIRNTPPLSRLFSSSLLASPLLVSLFLFFLALVPRLPDLGRFLTADEFLWVDRSRNFLAALTDLNYQCDSVVEQWHFVAQGLACTLRTGHPGVTTMWTGSFGFLLRWLWDGRPGSLHDYVVAVSTNPLDATFIAPERLGTVLITSLAVVALYWLARRLFGPSIALLGAILLALDPFHIALSRVIHHDALSTTFMTLSVLCAFIYWGEGSEGSGVSSREQAVGDLRSPVFGRYAWLLLSGLLAGLAFLSKLSSLFLMPFIALLGLWFLIERTRRQTLESYLRFSLQPSALILLIGEGLLWFAVALGVVFLIWPVMWVAPLETMQTAFLLGFKYTTGGHAKGNFLLGQVSNDPGVLFYLVTWLYRTTPLVLLGLAGALIAWLRPARLGPALRPFFRCLPLILLYILGYYLLMTLGEKKQERYFLPVYPWLNFIAAAGLLGILDFGFLRTTHHAIRNTPHALPTIFYSLIILFQATLVYLNFPYYFTYYNPLLGGIHSAAKAVTIGWGEGLDVAAAYLNEHTDPPRTRVASWYQSTFAPFYHGGSISYSKEKGKVLAGDYVIFYINQTQRRFPDDVMFDYFEQRFKPVKTISLNGLDYVWIYPSLGIDHYIEDQTYTGIASLLAWQWANGDVPLDPGRATKFDLYWEYLGKKPDEAFFFRVVDAQKRPWAEAESQPVAAENPPLEKWREGEIIVEHGTLTLPPDMPPGQYRLQIGFFTQAPAVAEGELLFTLSETESLITVGHTNQALSYQLPPHTSSINRRLGDSLILLGGRWPAQEPPPLATADPLPLDLYWRVEKAIPADFAVHAGLIDAAGVAQQAWFDLSLAETFNPSQTLWQPGDIIHTTWRLSLPPQAPTGPYTFELVLPATPTTKLSFGNLVIGTEEVSKK